MNSIAEAAKMGLSLDDVLIIDGHCHMGYWHNFNISCNNAEGMLVSMDTLGIDKAFITAHSSIGPNYRYGNDVVIDAVVRYPQRFIGYATVNPNYEKDMRAELDRCFAVPGIKGIKLHPASHGCSVDYKSYHIAYRYAQQKQCPVLMHIWGCGDVAIVKSLAALYPGVKFIMGHAGGDIRAMEAAIDVVNRHDNAYLDLAISRTYEGNVEWFVSEVGSKKVLYASDMPFLDPRPAIGRVALADISDEQKRDIFGLNLKRILAL